MKHLFYTERHKRLLAKIDGILGKDWFTQKEVLELGCSTGDISKKLLERGCYAHFSDHDWASLNNIKQDLMKCNFDAATIQIDQNKMWDLQKKFDLILHFGVLYLLENWQQDLECTMNHTDLMFLETLVVPEKGMKDTIKNGQPWFTQESVEQTLTDLNCKFIRIDTNELNMDWGFMYSNLMIRSIYDWDYDTVDNYIPCRNAIGGIEYNLHWRRFWIVTK